jgi:hypothetical protein
MILQRFVPRHEPDSKAAYGSNDSPSTRSAAKVIDAGESDSSQARLLCNNGCSATNQRASKRNISPLAEIKKLAASTVRPPSSAD